ncbi:MAG: trypsin-like serine protease [Thermoanaerobaculia bacterium]|nr:trypsin-like serine protease [Thermoanaerobaculia bacterium]
MTMLLTIRRSTLILAACGSLLSLNLATPSLADGPINLSEPIVNGVAVVTHPTTVAIVDSNNQTFCTGTLIGCNTVLTAAHCVCEGTGSDCQAGGPGLAPAGSIGVFAQHGGFRGVSNIQVRDNYEFAVTGDVALLELSSPMTGIQPTPINQTANLDHDTAAEIVGFGNVEDIFNTGRGIKRRGFLNTTACTGVPEAPHICWEFRAPLGAPGSNSNTCQGDSGGPLFVNFGSGPVVAGVTSGGNGCLAPDDSFDANVFFERDWITSHALSPLGELSCGDLPSVFSPGTSVTFGEGNLTGVIVNNAAFTVPADTALLRVALNGATESLLGPNDFELLLNRGSQPTNTPSDTCRGLNIGTNEFCEIPNPTPGTWWVGAIPASGGGEYQLVITTFAGTPPTACVRDENTACLLDGKFQVQGAMNDFEVPPESFLTRVMTFDSPGQNGRAESDQAVFFESFSPGNFEAGVKMVDACGLPEDNPLRAYWAFFGALTNAQTELFIIDTVTLDTYNWFNAPGQFPQSLGDTAAFPCVGGPAVTNCFSDDNQACLLDSRFLVSGTMNTFDEPPVTLPVKVMKFSGDHRAESDQAVFFESFSAGNFEVGVKMVDGCGFPPDHPLHHYWVFYGALTNAETLIQVTQMATGLTNEWYNPPGELPFSVGRTDAFPCE